jgi:nucleotide-binding universal stress UspA family protein
MSGTLSEELFEHVLIPVASEADAQTARETILPYLEGVGGVATVVHVVEQTEGGVDPSPPSMQEEDARELFEIVSDDHAGLVVETRTAYGSDIVESVFEVAREVDASAVVFSPEEKSRLIRLLTGDTALRLVTNPDVPVLAIPRRDSTG